MARGSEGQGGGGFGEVGPVSRWGKGDPRGSIPPTVGRLHSVRNSPSGFSYFVSKSNVLRSRSFVGVTLETNLRDARNQICPFDTECIFCGEQI